LKSKRKRKKDGIIERKIDRERERKREIYR